jgi:diguanylate cyclase (GGDEF)-like protein
MPPIAYIRNQSIYGFAAAYLNNIAVASDVSLEYTIGEPDKLNELLRSENLDIILSNTPTLPFYKEPLVIVSGFDTALHSEENSVMTFIDSNDISFDLLIDELDKTHIKIPLSMYKFILDKKEINHLFLNQILLEETTYGFIGNEDILLQLEHYNDYISEKRLFDLSLHSIPNEKNDKMIFATVVISSIVLIFLLLVYLTVRIIISINEKQRLNYLFKHDQLTYLLNHYGLKKMFNTINHKDGVMMLIDIRRFKLLNDTYGSDIGDQVLIEFSTILDSIADDLIVARTSGDQFTLLFNHNDYDKYFDLIMSSFVSFKEKEPHAEKLDLSACYVRYPEYTNDFDTLMQYLESTMYYAKSLNIINEWIAFDHDIYKNYVEEQELALEIQLAIEREELLLFYQPQTDLETERTIGAEVLVRWVHKERGNIYPDQFLGVAERNGLMRKLDMYMIKKACEQVKYWQENNYDKMKISVNMSTYTFESLKMSDELLQIVETSGIDTTWFAIEITEESGFSNLKKAKVIMDEIKAYGIRFALDDFGKGYSSISYLEQLPFDFLKIDKAFVDNIHTNEKSKVLYYLITDLAKLYNMHIIAEGVEYIEQINVIKKDLHTIIQGYYYSKPLTLDDFDNRVKNQ